MPQTVLASILHGAYGDLYEQALCLRHYAATHPDVELRLFAATKTRYEAFRVMDFSFASFYGLWAELEHQPDIDGFYQFQVLDEELKSDVLSKLPESITAKLDRETNHLPWTYLRDNKLIPPGDRYRLSLNEWGRQELERITVANGIRSEIWSKPTISFLWRYRDKESGAIRGYGQKSREELVASYSAMFKKLIDKYDCHILVCGMNVKTDDTNRERTDNKYTSFGLNLPERSVTYLQGLSWPIELEIASRATVSCGNVSGFTEGEWLIRGGGMVMMDVQYHYLAKAVYRRIPFFNLDRTSAVLSTLLLRSAEHSGRQIARLLDKPAK